MSHDLDLVSLGKRIMHLLLDKYVTMLQYGCDPLGEIASQNVNTSYLTKICFHDDVSVNGIPQNRIYYHTFGIYIRSNVSRHKLDWGLNFIGSR